MQGLESRLGKLFLQLPPSFDFTHLSQLEEYLGSWPTDARLAVEVPHPSFYTQQHALKFNTLLRQYNVGRVMMDTRPIRIEFLLYPGISINPEVIQNKHACFSWLTMD